MNSKKKLRTKGTVVLLLLLSLGLNSCKKSIEANTETNTDIKEGAAKVIVNMLGIDETGEPPVTPTNGVASGKLASVNKKTSQAVSSEIQESIVPFDKNVSIVATLVPQGNPAPLKIEAKGPNNRLASTQAAGAPAIQTTPLAANVMYVVDVFNDAGNFVESKRYIRGKEAEAIGGPDFVLDAGKTYTFVATSYNSTSVDPPQASPGTTLASAVFSIPTSGTPNSVGGSMYFKRTMTLTDGGNNLGIVLKHQLSEITTTVTLDPSIPDNIQFIGGGMITPGYSSASLKLDDGVITYSGSASGAQVSFNSIPAGSGVRSITSSPTLIATPATTTGALTISSLSIGGVMKTNLLFPDLNITPGVKYNLNLTLRGPCTKDVGDGVNFNINLDDKYHGPDPSESTNAPAADYGFVFNLTQLDNSFNMTINGTPLIQSKSHGAGHEIQFQDGGTPARNIKFADNTVWGEGSIPQIYNMVASSVLTPIIRVVISPTGNVSMYGSKVANGPLFPLELTDKYSFNHINWSTTGDNSVTVSQSVIGATVMVGSGSGKKIVPCTN